MRPTRTLESTGQVPTEHHQNVPLPFSVCTLKVGTASFEYCRQRLPAFFSPKGEASLKLFCETSPWCKASQMLPEHWTATETGLGCKENLSRIQKEITLHPPPKPCPSEIYNGWMESWPWAARMHCLSGCSSL